MSMYCINHTKLLHLKLLLLASTLILSSCAGSPVNEHTSDNDTSAATSQENIKSISVEELKKYKTALYAMRDSKLESAKTLLQEVILEHPIIAGPYANLGIIYYKQGDYDKSLKNLLTAIKLNPNNAYAHNTIAAIYLHKGKFSLSEKHLLEAVSKKQDYAKAHYNLALLYDIYFHKIRDSVYYYKKYLVIINNKGITDKKTVDWVEQLNNSLKKG